MCVKQAQYFFSDIKINTSKIAILDRPKFFTDQFDIQETDFVARTVVKALSNGEEKKAYVFELSMEIRPQRACGQLSIEFNCHRPDLDKLS